MSGMTPSQQLQRWRKEFKLKLQKAQTPALPAAPPRVTLRTCLAESSNPILASPVPRRVKRDRRQQFTLETYPTHHYL
jgi:hypothetical protein